MIQGEQVTLRSFEREDLRAYWEMRNDFEVEARVSDARPLPVSYAALESRFDAGAGTRDEKNLSFVIDVGGEMVGRIDIWGIDDHSKIANLGISIRRASWGKGYGQDAVRTVVTYAFTQLNMRKVSLTVLADDERAVACYRAAGFTEEGRLKAHNWYDGAYRDLLWMAVINAG